MEPQYPQNISPPVPEPVPPGAPAPVPPTQYPQQPADFPPPQKSRRKMFIILLIVALLLAGSAGAWFKITADDNKSKSAVAENQNENTSPITSSIASVEREGIQLAVNQYCIALGNAYGFAGMTTGYIISERFSEEVLSDSPDLLRFKQVGDAASATVDCEDAQGPNGISNDLLFAKVNGQWKYVDEEQNNAGSGFLCSVVEEYKVSKELVASCATSEGQPVTSR